MIPVVDFSVYELRKTNVADDSLKKLSDELRRAFTEVGFVYLKNTGISQDEVDKVMGVSKKFFCLPESMKKPFSRGNFSCDVNHGWVSLEMESLNPQRPGDLKEAFNATSLRADIVNIYFFFSFLVFHIECFIGAPSQYYRQMQTESESSS